jgi:hypothetical protein
MKLIPKDMEAALLRNGRVREALEQEGKAEADFFPVVKLFTPDAGCTWLLTELDPDDPDIAHGLCDLGLGCAELGSVRISEIESVRGRFGLPVERDLHFVPEHTIAVYARAAWKAGAITECRKALDAAAECLRHDAALEGGES